MACCKMDQIILHPECGDDPSIYETVPITHPLTGEPALMLAHKDNGDCIYLGAGGCENYENRPTICREYDCRKAFLAMNCKTRAKYISEGFMDRDKFAEGKKRVHTLTADERREAMSRRRRFS
jgi:Fe-S-cluster containining protein